MEEKNIIIEYFFTNDNSTDLLTKRLPHDIRSLSMSQVWAYEIALWCHGVYHVIIMTSFVGRLTYDVFGIMLHFSLFVSFYYRQVSQYRENNIIRYHVNVFIWFCRGHNIWHLYYGVDSKRNHVFTIIRGEPTLKPRVSHDTPKFQLFFRKHVLFF